MKGATNGGSPRRPQKQRLGAVGGNDLRGGAPGQRGVCSNVQKTAQVAAIVWLGLVTCGLFGVYTYQAAHSTASDESGGDSVADVLGYAQDFEDSQGSCGAIARARMVFPPMTFARASGRQHVLVTGGAGYIGSHASLRLLRDGHAVTIVDNLSRGNAGAVAALETVAKPGQLRFVDLDLGDPSRLNALFESSDFDLVIHFAAVAYVGESYADPLLYYKNVTANTGNVLEAMRRGGVRKIVYSSTCATYGNAKEMPITEETPQIPVNPYGRSKLMCEEMIKEYAAVNEGFDAVILRYFNVIGADPSGIVGETPVGPQAKQYGRISAACFSAALGLRENLSILGTDHNTPDGTCVRDYIHVVDLVDAHIKAFGIMLGKGSLHIYNVAVGKGHSVREFINACKNVTGKPITVINAPRRDGDAAYVYANPAKIKAELNWEPRFVDLRESLRTAWRWTVRHGGSYPQRIQDPHFEQRRI